MRLFAFLMILALVACDSEPPATTSSKAEATPDATPAPDPKPPPAASVVNPDESAFEESACSLEKGLAVLDGIVQHNGENPDDNIGDHAAEHWQVLQQRYRDALAAVNDDEAFARFWLTHGKAPDVFFARDAPYYRVVDGVPGAIEELRNSNPDGFISTLVTAAHSLAENGDTERLEELSSTAVNHASSASDWVDTAGIFAIIGDFEAAESALANLSSEDTPVDNQFGSHHLLVAWSRDLGPEAAMDRFFELISREWILSVLGNAAATLIDEGDGPLAAQMVTDPRVFDLLRLPARSYMSHDRILALVDRFSEADTTIEIVSAVMANIGEQQPVSALSSTDFLIRGLARSGCSQACLDTVLDHMPAKDAENVGTRQTVALTRNVVLAGTGRLKDADLSDPESLMLAAGSYAGGQSKPEYIEPLASQLPPEKRDRLYSFTASSMAMAAAMGGSSESDAAVLQLIRKAPMDDLTNWAVFAVMTDEQPEIRQALLTRATGGCPAFQPDA